MNPLDFREATIKIYEDNPTPSTFRQEMGKLIRLTGGTPGDRPEPDPTPETTATDVEAELGEPLTRSVFKRLMNREHGTHPEDRPLPVVEER